MKIVATLAILLSVIGKTYSTNSVPTNDTINLTLKHIEGRWVETGENNRESIYIFNDDDTFFKANDNQELLIFNIAGKYKLIRDTIRVVYQDLSRGNVSEVKVRTMYLQVIALSDNELNINKIENNKSSFIRLRRQNKL